MKLQPSSTKCLFRQMSQRDVDDELLWEIIYFLLLTLIHTPIRTKLGTLLRLEYSKWLTTWNCILLPLNAFLGKCPSVTWIELLWEIIYFLLLTLIHTHIKRKLSTLLGLEYSKWLTIWNCILLPLNAFLGKCPSVTWMMNYYGK